MKTHVSYNGFLQRINGVVSSVNELPFNALFVSTGRLVNPRGSYDAAPRVTLYSTPNGYVAVHV